MKPTILPQFIEKPAEQVFGAPAGYAPTSIAEKLVSVQPMTKKVGQIFHLDFKNPGAFPTGTNNPDPYVHLHHAVKLPSTHAPEHLDVEVFFDVKCVGVSETNGARRYVAVVFMDEHPHVALEHVKQAVIGRVSECMAEAPGVSYVLKVYVDWGDGNVKPIDEVDAKAKHFSEVIEALEAASEEVWKNTKVVCDSTNNTPEDIEQGKMNVDVYLPKPANHIELDVVIGPSEKFSDDVLAALKDGNAPKSCVPPKVIIPQEIDCTHIADQVEKQMQVDADAFKLIAALDHPSAQFDALKAKMKDLSEEQANQIAHDLVVYGQAYADQNGDAIDPASVHKVSSGYKAEVFPPKPEYIYAPYMPLYTTPPLTTKDVVAKHAAAVSVGCKASVGKDGHLVQESPLVAAPVLKKVAAYGPKPIDDAADDYNVGDFWYDSSKGEILTCVDNTVGQARWEKLAGVKMDPVHLEESDGKVILVPDTKKHYSFGSPWTDGQVEKLFNGASFEMTFNDEYLNKPVQAHWSENHDELQTHTSPEAESELVKALAEEVKKEVDAEVMKTLGSTPAPKPALGPIVPLPDANAPVDPSVVEMLTNWKQHVIASMGIPPHIMGMGTKVTNTK